MNRQTAMQQLLNQLKDERVNLPMDIEWDRCYQAIEMAIQNTYLPIEKELIIDSVNFGQNNYTDTTIEDKEIAKQYYKETFNNE